jgi:hypothetical protein
MKLNQLYTNHQNKKALLIQQKRAAKKNFK